MLSRHLCPSYRPGVQWKHGASYFALNARSLMRHARPSTSVGDDRAVIRLRSAAPHRVHKVSFVPSETGGRG